MHPGNDRAPFFRVASQRVSKKKGQNKNLPQIGLNIRNIWVATTQFICHILCIYIYVCLFCVHVWIYIYAYSVYIYIQYNFTVTIYRHSVYLYWYTINIYTHTNALLLILMGSHHIFSTPKSIHVQYHQVSTKCSRVHAQRWNMEPGNDVNFEGCRNQCESPAAP